WMALGEQITLVSGVAAYGAVSTRPADASRAGSDPLPVGVPPVAVDSVVRTPGPLIGLAPGLLPAPLAPPPGPGPGPGIGPSGRGGRSVVCVGDVVCTG